MFYPRSITFTIWLSYVKTFYYIFFALIGRFIFWNNSELFASLNQNWLDFTLVMEVDCREEMVDVVKIESGIEHESQKGSFIGSFKFCVKSRCHSMLSKIFDFRFTLVPEFCNSMLTSYRK